MTISSNNQSTGYLPTNTLEFYKRLLTVLQYNTNCPNIREVPYREEGQYQAVVDICVEYNKIISINNAIHCLTLRIAGAEAFNQNQSIKQQEETSPGLEKSPTPLEVASAAFLLLVKEKGSQLTLYELLMKFYGSDIIQKEFKGQEWILDASIAMCLRIYVNTYRQEIVDFLAGNGVPSDF